MDKKEIVNSFVKGIEKGDQTIEKYLTDTFMIQMPLPMPFGKAQVLMFAQMISNSIPDLKLDISDLNESQDKVSLGIKGSGTYKNNFMGMVNIPANGQKIELPVIQFEFIFSGDKISEIKLVNLPMAEIGDIMRNNGLTIPSIN